MVKGNCSRFNPFVERRGGTLVTENEWKTRKERIDKKLKALKPPWKIIKYSDKLDTKILQRCAVEEFPTANGPADYALFVKGRLLEIIEAKKVGIGQGTGEHDANGF